MYYQNKPKFNGVYSRNNVPDKTKDRAYVIKLWGLAHSKRNQKIY